jgi:hypothetical protein
VDDSGNLTVPNTLNAEAVSATQLNGTNASVGGTLTAGTANVTGNFAANYLSAPNGSITSLSSTTVTSASVSTNTVTLNGIATAGAACSPNGTVAQDGTGAILSCQSGAWKSQSANLEWTYLYIAGWTGGSFTPTAVGVPSTAKEVMLLFNCGAYAGGIYAFQDSASVGGCINNSGTAYGQGVANANAPINIWNPSGSNFVAISAYR